MKEKGEPGEAPGFPAQAGTGWRDRNRGEEAWPRKKGSWEIWPCVSQPKGLLEWGLPMPSLGHTWETSGATAHQQREGGVTQAGPLLLGATAMPIPGSWGAAPRLGKWSADRPVGGADITTGGRGGERVCRGPQDGMGKKRVSFILPTMSAWTEGTRPGEGMGTAEP